MVDGMCAMAAVLLSMYLSTLLSDLGHFFTYSTYDIHYRLTKIVLTALIMIFIARIPLWMATYNLKMLIQSLQQ